MIVPVSGSEAGLCITGMPFEAIGLEAVKRYIPSYDPEMGKKVTNDFQSCNTYTQGL